MKKLVLVLAMLLFSGCMALDSRYGSYDCWDYDANCGYKE